MASNLKDNLVVKVKSLEPRHTDTGKLWPVLHVVKQDGTEWLISSWALTSKEEVDATEIIGKYIELEPRTASRMKFHILTPLEEEKVF